MSLCVTLHSNMNTAGEHPCGYLTQPVTLTSRSPYTPSVALHNSPPPGSKAQPHERPCPEQRGLKVPGQTAQPVPNSRAVTVRRTAFLRHRALALW